MKKLLAIFIALFTLSANAQITFTALNDAVLTHDIESFVGLLFENNFTQVESSEDESDSSIRARFALDYLPASNEAMVWVDVKQNFMLTKVEIQTREHSLNEYLVGKIKKYCKYEATEKIEGDEFFSTRYRNASGVGFYLYSINGVKYIEAIKNRSIFSDPIGLDTIYQMN